MSKTGITPKKPARFPFSIFGASTDFQTIGQGFFFNNQRVITGRFKGVFNIIKNSTIIMLHDGSFTVHNFLGMNNIAD